MTDSQVNAVLRRENKRLRLALESLETMLRFARDEIDGCDYSTDEIRAAIDNHLSVSKNHD